MRYSDNVEINGQVKNGFDYDLQVWVEDYIVLDCGHRGGNLPDDPCCNSRKFRGRDIESAKEEWINSKNA
jgi:hypothetical protein